MKRKGTVKAAVGILALAIGLTGPAGAQRPIKAPDVGAAEKAPTSVYYERDYFSVLDDRLVGLGETSLWELSKNPNKEAMRFFWVPEEGPAMAVRIDLEGDKATLTWKRSTGVTEEDWGTVAEEMTRPLTDKELKDLRITFDVISYWYIEGDDPDDVVNSDGPLWLLEAVHGGKYHAVNRENPRLGGVRRLGLQMLSLAEISEEDVRWPRRPVLSQPPTP